MTGTDTQKQFIQAQSKFAVLSVRLFLLTLIIGYVPATFIQAEKHATLIVILFLLFLLCGLITSIISLFKNEKRRILAWFGFFANFILLAASFANG